MRSSDYKRVLEARAEEGLNEEEAAAPWRCFMADPRGFLKNGREVAAVRPVEERVQDWREVYPDGAGRSLLPIITTQAGRCMDCGIPFCHQGCPRSATSCRMERPRLARRLGGRRRAAARHEQLPGVHRACPAPCETACVLGINQDRVTIKNVEVAIADRGWDEGLVRPQAPEWLSRRDRSPSSASARPGSPPHSSSPEQHRRGLRQARQPCSATASPSSRWRSASSTAASGRWSARARSSAPASRSAAR